MAALNPTPITQERLREVLHYDPLEGVFTWRLISKNCCASVGMIAGSRSPQGEVVIGVDGARYRATRLAFLYVTGEWPNAYVAHLDGVNDNNRFANLRVGRGLSCRDELTVERLRELLNYDPETGVFTWRMRTAHCVRAGDVAGSLDDGYVGISIDGHRFGAHRLAWLHYYGKWPAEKIDHIDRVRHNNRIANLREADKFINAQNITASRTKKVPLLGVTPLPSGKFQAMIGKGGRAFYLGSFVTAERAHQAYLAAKRKMHPGFVE